MSDQDFALIAAWLKARAGIHLSPQKKPLVMGRLAPRMRHHGLRRYGDYLALLRDGGQSEEQQAALDLLTTNETQFFRERAHFDFLATRIVPGLPRAGRMRVWSAAAASGEEAYSIAMTLAAALGDAPWEVYASDVSRRMLARAAAGHYAIARARPIPDAYLRSYCLKGYGSEEGTFLIDDAIRRKVRFEAVNLARELPAIGDFDVIFLRNVMIYFSDDTKREVLRRVVGRLAAGGYLLIGHSESLNGLTDAVRPVVPSIYQKHAG